MSETVKKALIIVLGIGIALFIRQSLFYGYNILEKRANYFSYYSCYAHNNLTKNYFEGNSIYSKAQALKYAMQSCQKKGNAKNCLPDQISQCTHAKNDNIEHLLNTCCSAKELSGFYLCYAYNTQTNKTFISRSIISKKKAQKGALHFCKASKFAKNCVALNTNRCVFITQRDNFIG